MSAINNRETAVPQHTVYAAYQANRLRKAQANIHVLASIASVVNFLFLVCDLIFIPGMAERLIMVITRYGFSIILLFSVRVLQTVRSFNRFALIVTALESASFLLYLLAMHLYEAPNFLIQSLGLISLILITFIVPNYKGNMLALSLVGTGLYFLLSFYCMQALPLTDLFAAITYAGVTIVLCAVTVFGNERTNLREFMERAHLEQTSTTDFLTNTATRARLEEEAQRWMSFCRRQGLPLCLVFLDIDNFKHINDQFSHASGDLVLKKVAELMQRQLRNSDTIARWGGDEFVLLLPNVSLRNAVLLLDRIKLAISQMSLDRVGTISASFGVVEMDGESTYQQMLEEADALMYRSKKRGKGRISYDEVISGDSVEIS